MRPQPTFTVGSAAVSTEFTRPTADASSRDWRSAWRAFLGGGLGWFSVLALKMGGDVATISRGAWSTQLQALQA